MAGEFLKVNDVLKSNVFEFHTELAHTLDRKKQDAKLRNNKGGKVTEL